MDIILRVAITLILVAVAVAVVKIFIGMHRDMRDTKCLLEQTRRMMDQSPPGRDRYALAELVFQENTVALVDMCGAAALMNLPAQERERIDLRLWRATFRRADEIERILGRPAEELPDGVRPVDHKAVRRIALSVFR